MLSDIFSFSFTLLLPLAVDIDQNLQRHRAVSLRQHGFLVLNFLLQPPASVYHVFIKEFNAGTVSISEGKLFHFQMLVPVILLQKECFLI